ncbi:MAG TPA: ATP synthase F1 subunit epsilon [Acidimicrobiales bacterium]|nr:ATP synthase F1 subunit epsilon [Acidimicrobiales bacterium]
MATFPASLITPERILLEEEVEAVFLRTDGGDAAFMPGHTPLIGAIVPGPVRFHHEDGTEERAAVHGGFVQVDGDHISVLAPIAERAQDIDVERARRALDGATQLLAELGGARAGTSDAGEETEADRALQDAEAAQRRAEVRLEVAGVTDARAS